MKTYKIINRMAQPSNIKEFLVKSVIVRNANRDKLIQDCIQYRAFYEQMHCTICKVVFCKIINDYIVSLDRTLRCSVCKKTHMLL